MTAMEIDQIHTSPWVPMPATSCRPVMNQAHMTEHMTREQAAAAAQAHLQQLYQQPTGPYGVQAQQQYQGPQAPPHQNTSHPAGVQMPPQQGPWLPTQHVPQVMPPQGLQDPAAKSGSQHATLGRPGNQQAPPPVAPTQVARDMPPRGAHAEYTGLTGGPPGPHCQEPFPQATHPNMATGDPSVWAPTTPPAKPPLVASPVLHQAQTKSTAASPQVPHPLQDTEQGDILTTPPGAWDSKSPGAWDIYGEQTPSPQLLAAVKAAEQTLQQAQAEGLPIATRELSTQIEPGQLPGSTPGLDTYDPAISIASTPEKVRLDALTSQQKQMEVLAQHQAFCMQQIAAFQAAALPKAAESSSASPPGQRNPKIAKAQPGDVHGQGPISDYIQGLATPVPCEEFSGSEAGSPVPTEVATEEGDDQKPLN